MLRLPYAALLLCLGTTVSAQEIPPPLSATDFPPALSGKDLPRAEPPRVAKYAPSRRVNPGIPAPATPDAVGVPAGWTDDDSRAAAVALGKECQAGAWVARFRKERGVAPQVKVLPVRNRSGSSLDSAVLARELGSALGGLAAKQAAANVILLGALLEQNDAADGRELQSYLLALSAIDLESGEKLWTGLHRVRKLVERSSKKITRLSPAQPVELSGSFNDTDAAELASTLLRDLLASGWFRDAGPRVLRIRPPRNRSSERVSTVLLGRFLEHGLLRSGKARILCSLEELAELRAERARQIVAASGPPRVGVELASTHVLQGWLTSLVDLQGSLETRLYQLSMTATSVDDNRRVWIGIGRAKKQLSRP